MQNTILAAITTNVSRSAEPTQVLIQLGSPAGQQSGLLSDSAVSCENLITARQSQIIRTIGSLPPNVMQQVNDALKASLDIS
jgi:mRNA interferase MazF